jgi:DNA polymerase elongation subunit (family B)
MTVKMTAKTAAKTAAEQKSSSLHGKIIHYRGMNSLKDIPKRADLLDKNTVAKVDDIIQNMGASGEEPLLFLPNTLKEFHEKDSNNVLRYKILLFGILPDGRKTSVILDGIRPYFEVRIPNNMEEKEFQVKVDSVVKEKYRGTSTTPLYRTHIEKFDKKRLFVRIHFNTLWDRKKAMVYFQDVLHWKTTTDDRNHYERVVCRNRNFSLCAWNIIKKATYKKESVSKLDKTFRVKIDNLVEYDGDIASDTALSHEKTLVGTWDIEAYTNTGEMPNADNKDDVVFMVGKTYHWRDEKNSLLDICLVSRPCNARADKLTIICRNEKELVVATFMLDAILQPDFIIGFNDGDFDWPFMIRKAVRYNVLSFIKNQLTMYNEQTWGKPKTIREQTQNILSWDCRAMRVKLEASTDAYSKTLTTPGSINVDVRTMFRKKYPTSQKSSLKYFLAISNLGGKEDMPISELFRIFKESVDIGLVVDMYTKKGQPVPEKVQKMLEVNKEKMADVAHYCTIDAKRCQELMQKVNILSDKREVSNVSHTSLYDAIYFADGMKVRNLVIAEGQTRGQLFSTRQKPYVGDGKYPGAYVFPPVKGPVKPKHTVREHKQSTPEWKNVSDADLETMEKLIYHEKDYTAKVVSFVTEGADEKEHVTISPFESPISEKLFYKHLAEEIKYPISGLDFSSLYPSIIMAYNLSPEYMIFDKREATRREKEGHTLHEINFEFNGVPMRGWSVRHDTSDGVNLLPGKTENKFGLYPYILKKLFDKRSAMKKEMKKFGKIKEKMETSHQASGEEYNKICFQFGYLNSKQKALKVFMNTFYGETGNKLSPFFVLEIAAGITTAGQRNIKMAAELVTKNGCKLYYGDTDSCYISCPAKFFKDFDRRYYGGQMTKVEYCTALVKETFVQIDVMKKLTNAHLIADNGTGFLKMAYEEVLYPAMFLLKKMYCGVEHQSLINFKPEVDHLFTKGISITRRDTAIVLKKVCGEVLMEILSIESLKTVYDIVMEKIKEIYEREWKIEDFKKTAVYKPSKQNISVRTFKRRMEERGDPLCPEPAPGERFEYVVVRKYPYKYDMQGRKTTISVADKWEYFTYAKANNLEIDLDYYMTGGIVGQFSQMVAYMPQFQVAPMDDTPEAYDISVKKNLLTAKKFIAGVCKKLANVPECQGASLKALYKIANNSYKENFNTVTGGADTKMMEYDSSKGSMYEHMKKILSPAIKKSSTYYAECYIQYMRKKYGKRIIYSLLKTFSNSRDPLLKYRTLYVGRVETNVRQTLNENAKLFNEIFDSKNKIIQEMISSMKDELGLDAVRAFDHEKIKDIPGIIKIAESADMARLEEQKEGIALLNKIYNTLSSAMSYLENTIAIVERLNYYISRERQENPRPPGITDEDERQSAIEYIKKNLIDF